MFFDAATYLLQPRAPISWLVKDVLPSGGMCNIYGAPKHGKSFLALGMAVAISSGLDEWMGLEVQGHGPVAYLQIDTPRIVWMERLEKAQLAGHNISNIYVADIDSGTPYPFTIFEHGRILTEHLAAIAPIAIIVDTIRELHGGDENDSGVMKNVISALRVACGSAAICLVSHSKKEGQQYAENLMGDARGSSYVAGRMDAVVKCWANPKDDNDGLMTFQSRTASLTKIRMERTEANGIWRKAEEPGKDLEVQKILADYPGASERDQAKILSSLLGISPEAARKRIQRSTFKPRLVVP